MSQRKAQGPHKSQRRSIDLQAVQGIVERARTLGLSADDCDSLTSVVDTLAFLTRELEAKGASVQKLRRLLFGPDEEKPSAAPGKPPAPPPAPPAGDGAGPSGGAPEPPKRAKPKGHGRNGAAAFKGATKVKVAHASLHSGEHCPSCQRGKVYDVGEPGVLVRIRGTAPFAATVYEQERLRCNLCGKVFTAAPPEGVGDKKYDESVAAMVGQFCYGAGFPFFRIEKLQAAMGVPLPASTQWDLVDEAADNMEPAFDELVRQAAQGEVLHNDDTAGKVVALMGEGRKNSPEAAELGEDRKGVHTTGIVSKVSGHAVALFFTGPKHAGENLADVLAERLARLPPPIQMCDAEARNTAGDFESILANCLTHGRRQFKDVEESFPDECGYVLSALRKVYRHDARARNETMTNTQRWRWHRRHSGPVTRRLKGWLRSKLRNHDVEPNSGLGQAMAYMLRHWKALTLFLRVPGAPLDNNVVERALKRAILHRKNSLFYKTMNGARVGDLHMSLIHSAELNGVNPFDYLVALQRHHERVAQIPKAWMPWNYRAALDGMTSGGTQAA